MKHPVAAPSRAYDLHYDFPDGTRIGGGISPNRTNGHQTNKGNFGFWVLGPAGIRLGYLDHYFQVIDPENDILAFQTRFVVGRPNSWLLNKIIHKSIPDRLMKDWILHNIEESGETEDLVPALYNNPTKVLRKTEITRRKVI